MIMGKREDCENCKKWKTARCCERKQSGQDSGPKDWCRGFQKKSAIDSSLIEAPKVAAEA